MIRSKSQRWQLRRLAAFFAIASSIHGSSTTAAEQNTQLKGGVSVYGAGSYEGFDLSTLNGRGMSGGFDILPKKPLRAAAQKSDFRAWINSTYPGFKLFASKLNPRAIINIKGEWDNGSKLLFNLGFPHSNCIGSELLTMPLDSTRIILINCPGEIPEAAYDRLRQFVSNGGTLITSDCALSPFLQKCFPGYISWNLASSKEGMVDGHATKDCGELFAGGISKGFWKLDRSCQLIRVLNQESVTVITKSNALAKQDPDKQGILSVIFPYGNGRILHTLGHFDNNDIDAEDSMLDDATRGSVVSLRQMLIANLLTESLREDARNGRL